MILILSTREMEETTIDVMEWLTKLGGSYVRLNGEEILEGAFSLHISTGDEGGTLVVDGQTLAIDEIGAVWYRRSGKLAVPELPEIEDDNLRTTVRRHLRGEMNAARGSLFHLLHKASWMSKPHTSVPHKMELLLKAKQQGLTVPRTLISNDRDSVLAFREEVGEIIVKCLGDVELFMRDDLAYGPYTEILTAEHIRDLPLQCFPLLVQECVNKAWELRVFYLDGSCYSMAIFSQGDPQTQVDFRRYNFKKPSRMVPFQLSSTMENKIRALMNCLDLDTGSLDLIRSTNGETYFLEINPVGQFGMVSQPCNYHLEKRVAQYLMHKDAS